MIESYFIKRKTQDGLILQAMSYLSLKFKEIRKSILIPTIVLLLFGIVMSFSLSYWVSQKLETGDFYFFYKHCFFVLIGIGFMAFFAFIDIKTLKNISIFCYAFLVLMLISVLFIKSNVKGASRWIDFGFISIQPSEILKPFFIIIHSTLIFMMFKKNDINHLFLSISMFVVVMLLFALQPDYGMIIVYSITLGVQVLFSQIKTRLVLLIGLGLIVFLIASSFMFEHVKFRILTFLGMGDGDNYQLNIAMRAIQEGGFFGKGAGMGRLKSLLPDAHNDFIFAVIGEEMGCFGYILILAMYTTIFFSVFYFLLQQNKIISNITFDKNHLANIENYYLKRIIAMSIVAVFFIAVTINSFVSLGLFPTKGMTLPLISYGGSSVLSHCIMIGILLNITKYNFTNENLFLSGSIK